MAEEKFDNFSDFFVAKEVNNWDWVIDSHSDISFGNYSGDWEFLPSDPWDFDSIRSTIFADKHLGVSASMLLPERTQSVYVSYCMRFAGNWLSQNSGGKLPGLSGDSSPSNGGQGGNPANGDNAWSARMLFGSTATAEEGIPVGFYVYHTDQSAVSNYGDVEWWAETPSRLFRDTTRLERNRWYSIKQFVSMNDPWTNNGVLSAWLDGKNVYLREDLNFTNSEQFREIHRFWLNVYHGGGAKAPKDMTVYFDQVSYSFGLDTTTTSCSDLNADEQG